jgi:hypothetical protein
VTAESEDLVREDIEKVGYRRLWSWHRPSVQSLSFCFYDCFMKQSWVAVAFCAEICWSLSMDTCDCRGPFSFFVDFHVIILELHFLRFLILLGRDISIIVKYQISGRYTVMFKNPIICATVPGPGVEIKPTIRQRDKRNHSRLRTTGKRSGREHPDDHGPKTIETRYPLKHQDCFFRGTINYDREGVNENDQ